MCERSPFDISAKPVAVPDEHRQGSPVADYVALLQQLHETRDELANERTRRAEAENAVLVLVADGLRDAEQALKAALEQGDADEVRARSARVLERLAALWSEQGIHFAEATGRRVDDVDAAQFEVLSTRAAERPEDDGLIVETWRPAVWRRGLLVRTGQVVVARWQPDASEESR